MLNLKPPEPGRHATQPRKPLQLPSKLLHKSYKVSGKHEAGDCAGRIKSFCHQEILKEPNTVHLRLRQRVEELLALKRSGSGRYPIAWYIMIGDRMALCRCLHLSVYALGKSSL